MTQLKVAFLSVHPSWIPHSTLFPLVSHLSPFPFQPTRALLTPFPPLHPCPPEYFPHSLHRDYLSHNAVPSRVQRMPFHLNVLVLPWPHLILHNSPSWAPRTYSVGLPVVYHFPPHPQLNISPVPPPPTPHPPHTHTVIVHPWPHILLHNGLPLTHGQCETSCGLPLSPPLTDHLTCDHYTPRYQRPPPLHPLPAPPWSRGVSRCGPLVSHGPPRGRDQHLERSLTTPAPLNPSQSLSRRVQIL